MYAFYRSNASLASLVSCTSAVLGPSEGGEDTRLCSNCNRTHFSQSPGTHTYVARSPIIQLPTWCTTCSHISNQHPPKVQAK
ncbi:hypothetical protein DFP73DRAFT_561331 [Morchella snyderi]|nr:hypothetical protein DFP73DRAFT_561331 [Morchella snyderi]